jgi:hexosaminidase
MYRRLDAVGRDLEALGLHHRSVYPQMMQRMTGTDAPEALKILGDIVEPVKQLARGRMRKYTSLTPMNRLVDAVAPESDRAREFTRRVDLALATAAGLAQQAADLRRWLTLWRDNHPALRLVLQDSFLLGELETLSENVSLLANAGIQALEYLESGRRPPETWSGEQAALLQRADRAQAELLIMIIPGVRKLIAAANQRPTPLSSPGENAASAAQRF